MWLVCDQYVVGMWSVCGQYLIGTWLLHLPRSSVQQLEPRICPAELWPEGSPPVPVDTTGPANSTILFKRVAVWFKILWHHQLDLTRQCTKHTWSFVACAISIASFRAENASCLEEMGNFT